MSIVITSVLPKTCRSAVAWSSLSCKYVRIGNAIDRPSQSVLEEELAMLLKTQAATEIARFLAHHPTPEQIVAFHPSSEVAERAYELIETERDHSLSEEERQELEGYLVLEQLMELVKLEAHRQLRQQAS